MNLSRIGYILLILIAGYSIYYLIDSRSSDAIQVSPDLELPTLSGEKVDNASYTETGIRSYRITSDHIDYYAQRGNTKFLNPVLYIYRDGDLLEWKVTADRGELNKQNVLTLYNNVLANNLLPDASFDTMSTDKLNIQLDNRDFWADNSVLLLGPAFENKGNAVKGNFHDNIATLFNRVQGRYENLAP